MRARGYSWLKIVFIGKKLLKISIENRQEMTKVKAAAAAAKARARGLNTIPAAAVPVLQGRPRVTPILP